MATVVLGVAGAGVGSLIGGPAGALTGFRIGSAIGGIWDEISMQARAEAGKLKDARFTGSAFGASIPRVWGGGVVGSNIAWIQSDSSGNSLTKHGGGKKSLVGGGSLYFSATLAMIFCEGTMTFPDGTSTTHNPTIVNMWADDEQIYSVQQNLKKISYLTNTGSPQFDFYQGTETQGIDSIISAAHSLYPNAAQGIVTTATGGTFTLTFTDPSGNTQTSGNIAWNANQSNILTALQAMSNITTNCTTSGGGNGSGIDRVPVIVTFTGSLGGSAQSLLVVNNAGLTGGLCTTYPVTQGATPVGYRGLCMGVISNWRLSDWGNRVPNIKVQIATDAVTYGTVISDICRAAGLLPAQIDVSLCTATCPGFVEPNVNSGQESLRPLLLAGNIDMVNADGIVKFIPRGGTVSKTIIATDLAASTSGMGSSTNPIKRTQRALTDLPSELNVVYLDPNTLYQQGNQRVSRIDTPLYNTSTLDLPLGLTALQARTIAGTQLDSAWLESDQYEFTLPYSYLGIMPTDLVSLPIGSTNYRVRITEMAMAPVGELRCVAVPDDATNLTPSPSASAGNAPIIQGAPIPTLWTQWSGYEITEADKANCGFYVAANGSNGWTSCTVYYSLDGGTTYQTGGQINTASAFGVTTSTLATATVTGLDGVHTVGVDLTNSLGTASSVSVGDIAAGVNMALIGNEFAGVETSTLTSAYHYTLSNLFRGDNSSVMSGHATGERFIMTGPGILRVPLADSQVGTVVYVKCLSPSQDLSDVTPQTVTILAKTPSAVAVALSSLTLPTYVTETILASYVPGSHPGTQTPVAWTTISLAGYSVPATATEVTLYVEATDTGNDAGYQAIKFRSASGGTVFTGVGGEIYFNDADLHLSNQIRVPISASNTIDYEVLVGFQDGWKISLQAYWTPG